MVPTLLHKDAYLLILRLADVVDDTVTFTKIIWNELLEKNDSESTMLRFTTHVKASKVLLNLLAPQKRSTFLTKVSGGRDGGHLLLYCMVGRGG